MPLVIRGNDRKPHAIPHACALEIVDNEGRLAVVVTQSPSGSVQILTAGSESFAHYCRQVGGVVSTVHVHEDYAAPVRKR